MRHVKTSQRKLKPEALLLSLAVCCHLGRPDEEVVQGDLIIKEYVKLKRCSGWLGSFGLYMTIFCTQVPLLFNTLLLVYNKLFISYFKGSFALNQHIITGCGCWELRQDTTENWLLPRAFPICLVCAHTRNTEHKQPPRVTLEQREPLWDCYEARQVMCPRQFYQKLVPVNTDVNAFRRNWQHSHQWAYPDRFL